VARFAPHSIRWRLLGAFLLFLLVLAFLGFALERQARDAVQQELGRKLVAVGGAAAATLPQDLIPVVVAFGPGDEATRTYRRIQERLQRLEEATGVERLSLWSLEGRILVDTRPGVRPGTRAVTLPLYRRHLEAARRGQATSSILFTAPGGRVYMLGFSPLRHGGRVVGVVVVEGNALFLAAARTTRRWLLAASAMALLLGLAVAWTLAASVTRPLERLAQAARLIGRGDLSTPVPVGGPGEVRELAQTLERMRRDLQERDRHLRAMVAGVAHEIRNPLGGLVLYADLLRQEAGLSPEGRAQAEKILQEAMKLERIVEEFLVFARPAQPQRERVSLPDLWRAVHPLVVARCPAGERLVWEEDWGVREVLADRRHLNQILLNLALNAAEAVGDGGRVRLRSRKEAGDVLVEVEDSGPGVPPERYEEILKPFVTTKSRGAGLGLAMVRHLVQAHGGELLLARSTLGGLLVRLRFPEEEPVSGG
jgi:signal transduction histidine kinase